MSSTLFSTLPTAVSTVEMLSSMFSDIFIDVEVYSIFIEYLIHLIRTIPKIVGYLVCSPTINYKVDGSSIKTHVTCKNLQVAQIFCSEYPALCRLPKMCSSEFSIILIDEDYYYYALGHYIGASVSDILESAVQNRKAVAINSKLTELMYNKLKEKIARCAKNTLLFDLDLYRKLQYINLDATSILQVAEQFKSSGSAQSLTESILIKLKPYLIPYVTYRCFNEQDAVYIAHNIYKEYVEEFVRRNNLSGRFLVGVVIKDGVTLLDMNVLRVNELPSMKEEIKRLMKNSNVNESVSLLVTILRYCQE